MGFSRFVWLLQKKQLWLSRMDLLGDPWEIALAGDQLAYVISRHPPTQLPLPKVMPETAEQRSARIIGLWRRRTFVNCWSTSSLESHALWRIYCPPKEGVAIQTTLAKLRASVGGLHVLPVAYEIPGSNKRTPTRENLVTKKRPMFAYEQEVRIALFADMKGAEDAEPETLGHCLEWDPGKSVESIRIHPEADRSFMETVRTTVENYASALHDRVEPSAMSAAPPF